MSEERLTYKEWAVRENSEINRALNRIGEVLSEQDDYACLYILARLMHDYGYRTMRRAQEASST